MDIYKLTKETVFVYYEIPVEMCDSKTRKREIVQARQICWWLLKNKPGRTSGDIGKNIGGKDHASVLHGVKVINNLRDTDKKIYGQTEEIKKIFHKRCGVINESHPKFNKIFVVLQKMFKAIERRKRLFEAKKIIPGEFISS
jgi:hypothetical protein